MNLYVISGPSDVGVGLERCLVLRHTANALNRCWCFWQGARNGGGSAFSADVQSRSTDIKISRCQRADRATRYWPLVPDGRVYLPVNPKFEYSDVKFNNTVASQHTKQHSGHLASVGGGGAKDLRRRRMGFIDAI